MSDERAKNLQNQSLDLMALLLATVDEFALKYPDLGGGTIVAALRFARNFTVFETGGPGAAEAAAVIEAEVDKMSSRRTLARSETH